MIRAQKSMVIWGYSIPKGAKVYSDSPGIVWVEIPFYINLYYCVEMTKHSTLYIKRTPEMFIQLVRDVNNGFQIIESD